MRGENARRAINTEAAARQVAAATKLGAGRNSGDRGEFGCFRTVMAQAGVLCACTDNMHIRKERDWGTFFAIRAAAELRWYHNNVIHKAPNKLVKSALFITTLSLSPCRLSLHPGDLAGSRHRHLPRLAVLLPRSPRARQAHPCHRPPSA